MTVSSSTNRASYSGNGALTTFAYGFKVFDQDELTVILRSSDGTETVQTITTNYTVTGVGAASGGNVVFGSAPASGVTIVILRELDLDQGLDLVPNDPFPAQSLENSLDKLTFMVQQHKEELGRTIKASRTNVISGSEFTISASDRANKIFAFDSSGNVSITQEIGTFRGNWATATAYEVRDLVKDTSTNNIFLINAAHTSSGAQPLTTNANSAKYDLLVDAASATTSASAAAASETAAETAETNAETAQTAAETAQAAAETAETNAETAETNAETAKTAAETAQAAAEAVYDSFDDRYLGAKTTGSGDPTVDNDGNALIDGALFFDTTNNVMKVYNLGTTAWLRTTPTSSDQTNINALSVAAVIADMAILGTADVVNDMNILATADVVTDMNVLATADVVTDMNVLGTADVVNDMNVLGTSATVTAMNLLGTSAIVTDMSILGTADVVNDMNVLGTSANVTAMNILGTSGNVTAMSTVATNSSAVVNVSNNISSVNSFSNQYTISATEPSSPTEGMLWFDTSTDTMKVYNGSSFQNAGSSVNGTSSRGTFTETAGQTSFATTGFDSGYLDVFLNGVKLIDGTDFTATNGVDFVLTTGAALNDTLDYVAYGTFELANVYTKTASDARYEPIDATILKDADIGVTVQAYNATYVVDADIGVAVQAYDANTAKLDVSQTFTANQAVTGELIASSYNETYVALSGTTPAVNCEAGNVFSLTTSGATTFTFTNPPASGTAFGFMLRLTAGGTHTITYPSGVDWAGATAPDAPASGETDLLVFTTTDGGTIWYGALAIDAAG
jgi:hypothetical protein